MECNPDTVTPELLRGLSRRRGDPAVARRAVDGAPRAARCSAAPTTRPTSADRWTWRERPGFATFNLDLIYGAVGESLADWETHRPRGAGARAAARLRLRAHRRGRARPLAARPGPLPRRRRPGGRSTSWPTPCSWTAGLASYEISNWARPGHECRHNLLYWSQGDYPGFGCAAHSHRAGRRWWNVRTPERYIALVPPGPGGGRGRGARRRDPPAGGPPAPAADPRRRARGRPRRVGASRPGGEARAIGWCSPGRGRLVANEVASACADPSPALAGVHARVPPRQTPW